jgi:hypothetical protein
MILSLSASRPAWRAENMKRIIIIVIMIGLITFDIAIAQIAQNQEKPVLAILKLKALEPITENEAIQITNFLQIELLYTRRFTLIDRIQEWLLESGASLL